MIQANGSDIYKDAQHKSDNCLATLSAKIENIERTMKESFQSQNDEVKKLLENQQQAIQALMQTIEAKFNQPINLNSLINQKDKECHCKDGSDTASYISLSSIRRKSSIFAPIASQQASLSSKENETFFGLIGQNCTALATGLIYLNDKKSTQRIGVACFVKDKNKQSFFIRVYDCDNKLMIKEQDLREDEDECFDGLTFINQREADQFKHAIDDKLMNHLKKLMEKRTGFSFRKTSLTNRTQSLTSLSSLVNTKKDKKAKLTKDDISAPFNLVFRQPMNWNPVTGFEYVDCKQMTNV